MDTNLSLYYFPSINTTFYQRDQIKDKEIKFSTHTEKKKE